MPIQLLHKTSTQALALWKIAEEESVLQALLTTAEEVPTTLNHPTKRLEFLASRVVTQALVKQFNQVYQGIYKDEHGKPFLINSDFHISQSHSYPYVAVILDVEKNVGVDIEQKKNKLRKIAHRVFSEKEVQHAGDDLTKLCILWCAKETLIKLYGQKDLHLKEEISIDAFELAGSGKMKGRICRKHHENSHSLQYLVEEEYVLVFNP